MGHDLGQLPVRQYCISPEQVLLATLSGQVLSIAQQFELRQL
jgi:hypothetical protein